MNRKEWIGLTVVAVVLCMVAILSLAACAAARLKEEESVMAIQSPAFEAEGMIPREYTCDGRNVNPPLDIRLPDGIEAGKVQSLVLIVEDPDAPGGTFDHWLVWNIPPQTRRIEPGQLPKGAVEGRNSRREPGFTPPCPPSGSHRYFFRLYGLDIRLNLPAGSNKAAVRQAMRGHVVVQDELMGRYSRR